MKNTHDKPKKCGIMEGFMNKCLTNEDNTLYHIGPIILNLWQKCDGRRTLRDLTKLMSEENTETEYTAASIEGMLDLLEARKLITYTNSLRIYN